MSELIWGLLVAGGAYLLLKPSSTPVVVTPDPLVTTPTVPVVPVLPVVPVVPVQNTNVPSPTTIIPTQIPLPPVVVQVPYTKTVVDNQNAIWGLVGPIPFDIYRNDVLMPGQAADIRTVNGTVEVKGIDPVTAFQDGSWWRWTGSSWTRVVVPVTPAPLPTVPTSSVFKTVTDSMGVRWTLEGNPPYVVKRNGIGTGGYATDIRIVSGQVQVLGTDGAWWAWSGTSWTATNVTGPTPPPTPAPTGVMSVVAGDGTTWTLSGAGPNGSLAALRNGVHMGGGYGFAIRVVNGQVQIIGGDGAWWGWTGTRWTSVTSTASSTYVKTFTDVEGASWGMRSIGNGRFDLDRNGVEVASDDLDMRLVGGVAQVLGGEGSWWRWSGGAGGWWIAI